MYRLFVGALRYTGALLYYVGISLGAREKECNRLQNFEYIIEGQKKIVNSLPKRQF